MASFIPDEVYSRLTQIGIGRRKSPFAMKTLGRHTGEQQVDDIGRAVDRRVTTDKPQELITMAPVKALQSAIPAIYNFVLRRQWFAFIDGISEIAASTIYLHLHGGTAEPVRPPIWSVCFASTKERPMRMG